MPRRPGPEIARVAAEHAGALHASLERAPQTNEVGRSAALIGGLLCVNTEFGLPVRLFEIGASAGLNLRADRYHYRYDGGRWGPADSPVLIDDAWQGQLPPAGDVRIVERCGYDVAPLDVTGTEGELALLSYVWPDQDARLQRLRAAIAVARGVPAMLQRRTAAEAVTGVQLADGALTVLWHSITWQYLCAQERAVVREAVAALGARASSRAPFAHLTMEPARDAPDTPLRFLVRAACWPGGGARVLGECHAHGPPVRWQ